MMSNNEEKMRAEFEAWCERNGIFLLSRSEPLSGYIADSTEIRWETWQSATASKQREIDSLQRANESERGLNDALQRQVNALNKQLESERIHSSMQFDQIGSLKQQVLELSAMVEKMREALGTCISILGQPYEQMFNAPLVQKALSLSPSTALRDYVNEEVAKALGDVLTKFAWFSSEEGLWLADAIRIIAEEWRNRK